MWRNTPLNLAVVILTGILIAGNCRAAVILADVPSGLSVEVDTNGSYEITTRSPLWTFGGNVGYPLEEIKTVSGRDAIDTYQDVTFHWKAPAEFSASIRRYDYRPAIVFSVNAPAGVNV